MNSTYCVLDPGAENSGTRLCVNNDMPDSDANSKDVKKDFCGLLHCLSVKLHEAEVKTLHAFLKVHYFEQLYHRLFLVLYLVVNYYDFPVTTANLTKIALDIDCPPELVSLIIPAVQNIMVFSCVMSAHALFLFVAGKLSEFKRNWVWLPFFSQVLLEHRSVAGAGELASLKCIVLLIAMPLMLFLLTLQSRYSLAGARTISLCGGVAVDLVFALHVFMPYGSMQNLFTAVGYTVVYYLYSIRTTFKKVAVKSKTL
ncbi:hypothetical protein FBU31_001837 [Coemansia sp. 'formosensis']|nr:hypothetical protein FBU31_001837 [Coemansia sp. 'formosensis']